MGEESIFYDWDVLVHRFYDIRKIRTIHLSLKFLIQPIHKFGILYYPVLVLACETGPPGSEGSVPEACDLTNPHMDIDFPKEAGQVKCCSVCSNDILGGSASMPNCKEEEIQDDSEDSEINHQI
jgi:hypothetical protein